MSLELKNEKLVNYYQYDIDGLSKEEFARLRNYGLQEIQKDDAELVNYAINLILRNMIVTLSDDVKKIKQRSKQEINNKKKTKKSKIS